VLIHLHLQLLLVLYQVLRVFDLGVSELLETHDSAEDRFQVQLGQLFGLETVHCLDKVVESRILLLLGEDGRLNPEAVFEGQQLSVLY